MKVAKSTGFLFFILIFSLILFNSNLAYAKDIFFGTIGDQIILNGNVGVGTTAPTQALEIGTEAAGVNLKIKATLGSDVTPTFIAGNWTATNGWSADGTNLVKVTNAAAGTITPSGAGATPVIGATYKIVITCSAKGAAAVTYTYGGVAGTAITVGTITDYITAYTVGKLIITGAISSTATITAIDIYPLTVNTGSLYQNGNIRIAGELTGPAGIGGLSISPSGSTYNRGALTIAGALTITGALSGVTTLSMGGALSGVTTLSMNNALSGVTTGAFSGAITDTQSLTTTPTNGFAATAAAALVGTPVRISPSVIWSGSAWNTTVTAATKANAIEAYLLPVTGGTTSGSLVFANRTVNGAANSTEIMRLTTAGYVGIGTTNPGVKLDVNGAFRSSSATISTIGAGIIMADASGNLFSTSTSVATGIPSPAGITGQTLYSNGTNWIASNTLYNNGTNVGIGTTAPSQKLYVAGNINVNTNGYSALFSTYKGANSDGYNIFIGGGGQSSIGAVGETFKGSYNTAIGDQALYSIATGTENTATGFNALKTNTDGSYNTAYGSTALYNNISGTYNTATGYRALFTNTTGVVNSAHGGEALQDNTTGTYNAASGAGALMRNTTGDDNSALGAYSGRWIADGLTGNLSSSGSVYLGAYTKALANGDGNEIVIGYNAVGVGSNSVVLGNDDIETTVLKGNVGIGTTTPTTKLQVTGIGGTQTIRVLTTDATNVTAGSYIDLALGTVGWGSGMRAYVAPGQDYDWQNLEFYNSSYSDGSRVGRMTIDSTGNVGIGTTAPNYKLHLTGTIASVQENSDVSVVGLNLVHRSSTLRTGNVIQFNSPGYAIGESVSKIIGWNDPQATDNSQLEFQTFGGGAFHSIYMDGAGNLGIGTTTPGAKLDVRSSDETVALWSGLSTGLTDGRALEIQANGDSYSRSVLYSDGKYAIGSGSAARDTVLSRYGANTFRISSDGVNGSANLIVNGYVGIGTTNPVVALDVAGKGRFVSGTFPVLEMTRTVGSGWGYIWGAQNLILNQADNDVSGIGTYYKVNNSSGTSVYAGAFGGGLSTVTAGSEIGFIGFKAAYNGTDPSLSSDNYGLKLVATSDSADNAVFSGNVGIGVPSPGYKLDVSGSIHGTSYYSSDNTVGMTATINVRNSTNTGACTITVKNGLVTATTCP